MEVVIDNEVWTIETDESEVVLGQEEFSVEISDNTLTYINFEGSSVPLEFDYSDFVGGKLTIGLAIKDLHVFLVNLEIISAFNSGIIFTVGDEVAQGRLMVATDNNPQAANTYQSEPHYEYSTTTIIKLFASGGTPSQGSGKIILYSL